MHQEFCEGRIHCEYDNGYIVLNPHGEFKVWRRRVDVLDIPEEAWPSGLQTKPDEEMIKGNSIAEEWYLDANCSRDPDHLRGQFIPWARLSIRTGSEAFKLVRGTLLIAGSWTAYLYDIEKAELQQTIVAGARGDEQVRYVDISGYHVLIGHSLQLDVYNRETGSPVLNIPAGTQSWNFYANPENQWGCTEKPFHHGELRFRRAVRSSLGDRADYFQAGA